MPIASKTWKDLEIQRPNQVWVADITYIRLRREFVYLAVLMGVFTRCLRGCHLGRSLDQSLTLSALEKALAGAVPEIHHSDQGVQYAATDYVARLQGLGVTLSMAAVGEPRENGYAERLMRTGPLRLSSKVVEHKGVGEGRRSPTATSCCRRPASPAGRRRARALRCAGECRGYGYQ